MKEDLLGTIIWSTGRFYYSRMMKILNLAILKIKIGGVNMLNIQDISHLSKKEQKAYKRFVESVENGNLPVLFHVLKWI